MKKTKSLNELKKFCDGLESRKFFLLASHVKPEGDAIGSLLAVESLLRRLGKKTFIACEDSFPERLNVLPSKKWNQIHNVPPTANFDALLVADCPTLERIGKVKSLLKSEMKIFNLDHHHTNRMFGDYNFVQTKAAACGEVVYDIFKHFKMPFTKEEMSALYVSITTDTGSFKYSNTTVKTHQIAAELIGNGLDVERINDDLHATYSLGKMKLYSRLLAKVKTSHRHDIAWAAMTRRDLRYSGASEEDAEGFIDFLKYIREVKFSFFMIESETPKTIRVSFRSKDGFDASRVAAAFQGGGHQKASGCMIYGTLDQAEKMILSEVVKQF